MNKRIKILRILLVIIVLFESFVCASLFTSCSPAPNPQIQQMKEYEEFERLCKRLCSPYVGHIVGRPMPGRLDRNTKCLCESKPPRFVAKWE